MLGEKTIKIELPEISFNKQYTVTETTTIKDLKELINTDLPSLFDYTLIYRKKYPVKDGALIKSFIYLFNFYTF
jgi:hypothetical protein